MNTKNLYIYKCKIGRVIDGDTVELSEIDLGFGVTLKDERVRIQGIDAPESRTSDKIEKIFGNLAKSRVQNLLEVNSEHILISTDFKGKFGRILGDIVISDKEDNLLSEVLLSENHAVKYNPKSKIKMQEQHLINRSILIKKNIIY